MAKQKSIIKLDGTIGDITFYRSKDGYMAREKGGVSAERIQNDPAFRRTRENGAEFGRAGKSGKILRNSIRVLLQNVADSRMVGRLTKQMLMVIKTDGVNQRGLRAVQNGDMQLLNGFDFNANAKLSTTLYEPYEITINRVSGSAQVEFQDFAPDTRVNAPEGATHFKLMSAGMAIDFETEETVSEISSSALLVYDPTPTGVITLVNMLTPASTLPIFLVLGMEFYQEVNGVYYPLKNGSYNALQIVAIDLP